MRPPSPVIQLIAHLSAGGGWVIGVITVRNQVTLSEMVLHGLVGLVQSVEKSRPGAPWGRGNSAREQQPWLVPESPSPSQQAAPQVTNMPALQLLPPTHGNKSLLHLLRVLSVQLNPDPWEAQAESQVHAVWGSDPPLLSPPSLP